MADINLESLYKKSYNKDISYLVNELYRSVKDKIYEANRSGAAEIFFPLPDNLQAGQLEPDEVQLLVYTDLIEKIEESRLKVSIIISDGKNGKKDTILHVKWPAMLDKREKDRRVRLLAKHIEHSND